MEDNPLVNVSTSDNICDDDIIEGSVELDFALISYALNTNRLVFIKNPRNWSEFHATNGEPFHNILNYSNEQLSKRFLQHILPNIYKYELTEIEEHVLHILELHPNFRRTEHGFIALEPFERITIAPDDASIQKLIADYFVDSGISLDSSNHQILVSPYELDGGGCKIQMSAENKALISTGLTSNEDLFTFDLLSIPEMQKRLKHAKHDFKDCGKLPENIKILIDDLLKILSGLLEIRVALTQLLNIRFEV